MWSGTRATPATRPRFTNTKRVTKAASSAAAGAAAPTRGTNPTERPAHFRTCPQSSRHYAKVRLRRVRAALASLATWCRSRSSCLLQTKSPAMRASPRVASRAPSAPRRAAPCRRPGTSHFIPFI
ncbi:hypothetical protein EVAR_85012_1 [Eumeta japonica]|uniref:Uncharacterized protein n=1 Tax=Eumeta variegata TaxID=151549 RepID=A0A4C1W954_EUMVA|nr:hypothetical protein EVAR_85012_1 [Eumeta japonica]